MNIAIVFGGKSIEHDVSIVTAKQIYEVAKTKYDCILLYYNKNNELFVYKNKDFVFSDFRKNKDLKKARIDNGHIVLSCGVISYKIKIECAIMCCHGGVGENGSLESNFLLHNIPVSAGSPVSLGIAMDKWKTKLVLSGLGINVVNGVLAKKEMNKNDIIGLVESKLHYPVIVKPTTGGSSIGIEIAHNKQELTKALEVGFQFDGTCVIENVILDFEEYNQAVFGDSIKSEISYIEKPKRCEEILTFEDKYLSGGNKKTKGMKGQQTEKKILLKPKFIEQMKLYSKQIFDELGFYGVIRIDYIFDTQNEKLYVNEINAVPGSLAIYFFSKNNSAIQFIERLIEISINNYEKYSNFSLDYATKLF